MFNVGGNVLWLDGSCAW